jgi:hypothetical protein
MIDLSTNYLGLKLKNPVVVSASPLSDEIETIQHMERAGAAAGRGRGAHWDSGHGVEHFVAQSDLEFVVGNDRLCDGQTVRVQAGLRDGRNDMEGRICAPVGVNKMRLDPLRRDGRAARDLVADGGGPFPGKIFAAFEAGCVIEQEIGVTEVAQGDVPVRISDGEETLSGSNDWREKKGRHDHANLR